MNHIRRAFTIVGIVLGIMMPVIPASADLGTLPPGRLSALTANWWQWALSIPKSRNLLLDKTGENCMVGQRGFVWFLAGTFFGGSATRTCSVPEDKSLFFPVTNLSFFNSPNACGQGNQSFTAAQERAAIKPIDAVKALSVTVDGTDVKKTLLRRVQSQVFDVVLPDDNIFTSDFSPCPGGIYSPTVGDGYYVSLGPLTPGSHTIHFHGEDALGNHDVIYNLDVVPVTLQ
jgi:hypothetical protein